MEFIDLQRQFHDLQKNVELEDLEHDETERLISLSEYEFGPSFSWAALLQSERAVVLAGAGSGKTKEMQEQAKRLAQEGRFAFFVPLDDLGRGAVVDVLSPTEEDSFNQWKANGHETAWFFLDAVDELKLAGGKLDRALNRLSKDLNGFLDLARVIISCRPSDWRPVVDLNTVKNTLRARQGRSAKSFQPSEEAFVQAIQEDRHPAPTGTDDTEGSEDRERVRIVRMLPMNRKQIRLFAELSGIDDPIDFLNAINQQDAVTFARRPLDLSDLITAWKNSRCLGTRSQQHEENVSAKLKDDPERRDSGVLVDTRARHGAERLALALALARRRTIRSPEQATLTEDTDGVLDAAGILTDWTEKERQTLLRRALFDPATYGRVRFHHRSIQEYLAACRLRRLREDGMSVKALFRLLFAEQFGYQLVIPSMRPITAWLTLWDDAVRQELIRREPETLISLADPAEIPLPARKDLLRTFVAHYSQNEELAPRFLLDDVRRLAHPELGPVIRECWVAEPANQDVRLLLVQLIWQGSVADCADLAYEAARDGDAAIGSRTAAIRALLACGRYDAVRELASAILAHPEFWPAELVFGVAADLFPDIIGAEELVTLIEERSLVSGETIRNFDWYLRQVVESLDPQSEQATDLRGQMADLIWRARRERQELHLIRSEFSCLAPALAILCERQLAVASGKPDEEMIRACVISSRFGGEGSIGQDPERGLGEHFGVDSDSRQDAFWAQLAFMDEMIPCDDPRLRLHHALTDSLVGSLDIADRPWFETALQDESRPERRIVALYALIQIWHARGKDASDVESIRDKLKGDADLGRILTECTTPNDCDAKLERMQSEWQEEKRVRENQDAKLLNKRKKWRMELLADPAAAFSAGNLRVNVHNLYLWLSEVKRGRNRFGLWDRQTLTEAFGPDVVNQAEAALREFWRTTTPILWSARPAEDRGRTPYVWIYGLQGLLAEAATQGWTNALSPAEARTAAAYATIELNGFAPFICDLAESHPHEVEAVVGGEVSAELRVGGSQAHLSTLQNLAYADAKLKQLVVPRLVTVLESWPEHCTEDTAQNWAHNLSHVLRILHVAREETDRQAVARECARRFKAEPMGPLALDWLSGLFRFDAVRGTEALVQQLAVRNDPGAQEWAVQAIGTLFGTNSTANFEAVEPTQRAHLLNELIRQAHAFVRPEDDQNHQGVYSPNARDDAQMARNFLLNWLRDTPGTETCRVLLQLAEEQDCYRVSEHMRSLARERAAANAEFPSFSPKDVIELETRYEAPPHNRDGLFAVMMDRLVDIDHDLAHDDFSDRRTLRGIDEEPEMQRTLARRMRDRANGLYEVTREEEVADRKRTDIRLLTGNGGQKAVAEVKISDHWTVKELQEALRGQLVGKYLRHTSCKAGCLLLVYRGKKNYWVHPETNRRIKFAELIRILKEEAQTVEAQGQHDVRITTFGIDLSSADAPA